VLNKIDANADRSRSSLKISCPAYRLWGAVVDLSATQEGDAVVDGVSSYATRELL
jgi:hypothetical protein